MNAVVYARVSSKDQEREGFSIPAQFDLLRSYSAGRGLRIAQEFAGVETAKQARRVAFGDTVAFAKKHRVRLAILVEKTHRLYRNLRDLVIMDELDVEIHVEIHLVKENVSCHPSPDHMKSSCTGIRVLMAKTYIDNLSEEPRKGMIEKAKQAIWPSYAPLGSRERRGPRWQTNHRARSGRRPS
jgi:DNA invertase Pin-like site-specific DNA recombinase